MTVSLRWLNDFKAFFDWAIDKWRPGLSIDKDIRSGGNSGNMYAPETCCFVTQKENNSKRSNNVYLTYNGETKCLMEWSEITHISYYTLLARIQRFGWPSEKALTVIPKTNYTR